MQTNTTQSKSQTWFFLIHISFSYKSDVFLLIFFLLSRECNSRALLPPCVFPNGNVLAVRHPVLFIATGVRFTLCCTSSLHYVHILSVLFVRHWNCFCHWSVSVNFLHVKSYDVLAFFKINESDQYIFLIFIFRQSLQIFL